MTNRAIIVTIQQYLLTYNNDNYIRQGNNKSMHTRATRYIVVH